MCLTILLSSFFWRSLTGIPSSHTNDDMRCVIFILDESTGEIVRLIVLREPLREVCFDGEVVSFEASSQREALLSSSFWRYNVVVPEHCSSLKTLPFVYFFVGLFFSTQFPAKRCEAIQRSLGKEIESSQIARGDPWVHMATPFGSAPRPKQPVNRTCFYAEGCFKRSFVLSFS